MKTIRELGDAAGSYGISEYGDAVEKKETAFIQTCLPAYEAWWQLVVFPFRKHPGIWLKSNLPIAHEVLAIYNYSLFRSALRSFEILIEAQRRHMETDEVGSDVFYDFYIWIAMSYERIRQQAGAVFEYLFSESPRERKNIMQWRIGYEKLFDHLPTGFAKRFGTAYGQVTKYRDNIIHGPKFPGGKDRVPKPNKMKSLIYWSEFAKLVQRGEAEWKTQTVERLDIMIEMWLVFEDVANEFLEGLTATVLKQLGTSRLPDHDLASLPSTRSESRRTWTVLEPFEKSGSLDEGLSSDTTFPS